MLQQFRLGLADSVEASEVLRHVGDFVSMPSGA
jgi:hypothetical protein